MKKHIIGALASVVFLSSFQAFAMSDDDIEQMNVHGKIEAALADQRCSECDGIDLMEGKIAASAVMNMHLLVQESQKKVNEIIRIGDMVGQSMDDSHGLIKFIGEQETFAQMALNEMKSLEKQSAKMSNVEALQAHSKMAKLAGEIRSLNEETQITLDKVMLKMR